MSMHTYFSRQHSRMSEFTRKQLIGVATSTCLEIGQFVHIEHPVECNVEKGHDVTCAWDDMPTVEDFNFMRVS